MVLYPYLGTSIENPKLRVQYVFWMQVRSRLAGLSHIQACRPLCKATAILVCSAQSDPSAAPLNVGSSASGAGCCKEGVQLKVEGGHVLIGGGFLF